MAVAKLCEMGFSPEEAKWAVKQAAGEHEVLYVHTCMHMYVWSIYVGPVVKHNACVYVYM
jgi:hypothetical protein